MVSRVFYYSLLERNCHITTTSMKNRQGNMTLMSHYESLAEKIRPMFFYLCTPAHDTCVSHFMTWFWPPYYTWRHIVYEDQNRHFLLEIFNIFPNFNRFSSNFLSHSIFSLVFLLLHNFGVDLRTRWEILYHLKKFASGEILHILVFSLKLLYFF